MGANFGDRFGLWHARAGFRVGVERVDYSPSFLPKHRYGSAMRRRRCDGILRGGRDYRRAVGVAFSETRAGAAGVGGVAQFGRLGRIVAVGWHDFVVGNIDRGDFWRIVLSVVFQNRAITQLFLVARLGNFRDRDYLVDRLSLVDFFAQVH